MDIQWGMATLGTAAPLMSAEVELTVCTENLNPDVMVMKSAEYGCRYDAAQVLNGTMDRRILVERPMSSQLIIVSGIL